MSFNEFAREPLKAPEEVNRVYFYGMGGSGVSPSASNKFTLPDHLLLTVNPRYAVLEIGGNDVDSPASPKEIAQGKINLAENLVNCYDVRAVSLSTVLPRSAKALRCLSQAEYQEKLDEVNFRTSRMTEDTPAVYFYRHKGFWKDGAEAWSRDGVHADTEEAMRKYQKAITQCLHKLIKSHHAQQ